MKRHRNDGLKKRCACSRRTWAKCPHPWHFSFHFNNREWRYSLDKVATLRVEPKPRTKGEAQAWADTLRGEIRNGIDPVHPVAATPDPNAEYTLRFVLAEYQRRHVDVPTRRLGSRQLMTWHLRMLERAEIPGGDGRPVLLVDKTITQVTKADIEALRDDRRRVLRSEGHTKGGEVGINRYLARLRHVFSWAIVEGYVKMTPFKRGDKPIIKLNTAAETPRDRRLLPGEERKLLDAAQPHLQALIIAALDSGCRVSELLSLTWTHVRYDEQGSPSRLALRAEDTKTAKPRSVPVTKRLAAVLDMRRTDPRGGRLPGRGFVFGTPTGEPIHSIKTAWRRTCERAGIEGLHFHDLRREYGSRLMDSGGEDHSIRDLLGHANITTTSRYLKSSEKRQAELVAQMETVWSAKLVLHKETSEEFAHRSHKPFDEADSMVMDERGVSASEQES